MTYRTFRRRLSEATAAHDWLEGVSFVLGLGSSSSRSCASGGS